MRVYLPALGYAYVGLALVAFAIAGDHLRAAEAFLTIAGFAYLWFLGSLRTRLVRYDPDGFFAAMVLMGGAAYLPLQATALVSKDVEFAALGSPAAATVVVGPRSRPCMRARCRAGTAALASSAASACSASGQARRLRTGRSPGRRCGRRCSAS